MRSRPRAWGLKTNTVDESSKQREDRNACLGSRYSEDVGSLLETRKQGGAARLTETLSPVCCRHTFSHPHPCRSVWPQGRDSSSNSAFTLYLKCVWTWYREWIHSAMERVKNGIKTKELAEKPLWGASYLTSRAVEDTYLHRCEWAQDWRRCHLTTLLGLCSILLEKGKAVLRLLLLVWETSLPEEYFRTERR
jgi:hypothetical protein